jgi:hypothetical protein
VLTSLRKEGKGMAGAMAKLDLDSKAVAKHIEEIN